MSSDEVKSKNGTRARHRRRRLLYGLLGLCVLLVFSFSFRGTRVPLSPLGEHCPRTVTEMLPYVVDRLERHEVPYFLNYGTLLGAVRDESVIPWTSDIDISIVGLHEMNVPGESTHEPFLEALEELESCFSFEKYQQVQFALYPRHPDAHFWGPWYNRQLVNVDFYDVLEDVGEYKRVEGVLYAPSYIYLVGSRGKQYASPHGMFFGCPPMPQPRAGAACSPTSALFPLNKTGVWIGGRQFAAPHEPSVLLENVFGPDWRTPDSVQSGSWG